MNVYDLVAKFDGEIVCNAARVRVDGEWVEIGKVAGDGMVFTEAGSRLAEQNTPFVAQAEPDAPKPVRRTKKQPSDGE